jgi:hypothetical protein
VLDQASEEKGSRPYPLFSIAGLTGYLANGEIGIGVGMWKTRGNPKILNVEFSSQQGFAYSFYGSDFREEGEAALELAYALTIHKAQGSQFKLVILVLPGRPDPPSLDQLILGRKQTDERSLRRRLLSMRRGEAARQRTKV